MGNGVYILFHHESIATVTSLPESFVESAFQEIDRLNDTVYFAMNIDADAKQLFGKVDFTPKRDFLLTLDEPLRSVIVKAYQLVYWDNRHQFCGACASKLQKTSNKCEKSCPNCHENYYPILSPAVIVLIRKGEEILLARSSHFPPGIHALIAGFIEPGETAEACIHREIFEEVGLKVTNLQYFGSQSWPTPSSLMLGFTADYSEGEISLNDGEIETAGWFSKSNLPILPSKASIAYQMIRSMMGD